MLLGIAPRAVWANDKPAVVASATTASANAPSVAAGKDTPPAWQLQVTRSAQALKDESVSFPIRRHYFWSNERRHDLFFPALSARRGKGAHVGVGGDQNYTLAAAVEAKVMWLLDIDPHIARMHRLYAALLPIAETPAAFLTYFDADRSAAIRSRLVAVYGFEEARQILDVYQGFRVTLNRHLQYTAKLTHAGQPTTWLSNLTMYQHVQELAKKGLIVARVGNVYGPRTLMGIGQSAEKSGLTVATMYFSNAEAWFQYNEGFRRNMAALPFDEHSVILRTLESKAFSHPSDDFWHFAVQSATDFVSQMQKKPKYRTAEHAMLDAKALNPPVAGLSYIGIN